MPTRVAIVPHTHWDREWYSPFQTFRLRLVDLLDDLLPMLERDPSYAHFLLDGQMAVVDGDLVVGPVLWMNGTDHLMPQPWLGRVVAEANALQDEYELIVRGLAAHVRD